MSEKHLTELPWKQLATKQKIKDPGLGKALAAYGKAGEQEYDARLKALDEIKSQAVDLQKDYKKDKEVADYLGDVLKEVDKTRKAIEDFQKSGGGDEDEGEAEEYKKDLKRKLVSAMAQVKGRAPGAAEPGEEGQPQLQFMAYVASGASAVIVAKKVGGATKKLLPEIAGGASGGKYIQGECIFEKNMHTFVVEKVPGGLAKKLSKALLAETGIKYKVRVRSIDGAQELDSDTDTDADEIPTAPPPPSSGIDPKQLLAALNKLTPLIKKAIEADPARKDEILKPVAEFQALLKANQLDQAKAKLIAVGTMLKSLGAAGGSPSTQPQPTPKETKPLTPVWNTAKETLDTQLSALQLAMRRYGDPGLDAIADEIAQALGSYRTGLITALMDYDSAPAEARSERAGHVVKMIEEYRKRIASDKIALAADNNPFDLKLNIQTTLTGALDELSSALGA
jgi:tetratricopeptide (TPR) repeat protein